MPALAPLRRRARLARGPASRLVLALILVSTASAAPPRGWRGDGTGRYPDADPPLRWSPSSGGCWKTALPDWGNASPIIAGPGAGDRLVVAAEPTRLLALRLRDGKLLWERELSVVDTLPPDEAARAREEIAAGRAVEKQLRERQSEYDRLKREARKRAAPPEVSARLAALAKELDALKIELDRTARYRPPEPLPVIGGSTATPVTDGKTLFAVMGNGVVAALDLDGRLRWARWFGFPDQNMNGYSKGHSASPLLVKGRLIVALGHLRALDARDGRDLWKGREWRDYGTPAIGRAGGEDVILTPAGEVVRAADGQVLAGGPSGVWYLGPLVDGEVAYWVGSRGDEELARAGHARAEAFRLPAAPGEPPALLWRADLPPSRFYASPVIADGRLFAVGSAGQLVVLDARTGARLGERRLDLGAADVYPSLTVAGRRIYASSEAGVTVVLDPRPPFAELARNTLQPFRATPIFAGRRMYVRGMQDALCVEKR